MYDEDLAQYLEKKVEHARRDGGRIVINADVAKRLIILLREVPAPTGNDPRKDELQNAVDQAIDALRRMAMALKDKE